MSANCGADCFVHVVVIHFGVTAVRGPFAQAGLQTISAMVVTHHYL